MVGTLMISSTPSIINFSVGKWRNHREIYKIENIS